MELILCLVVVAAFIKIASAGPKSREERDIDERNHNNIEARKELFARMYEQTGADAYKPTHERN